MHMQNSRRVGSCCINLAVPRAPVSRYLAPPSTPRTRTQTSRKAQLAGQILTQRQRKKTQSLPQSSCRGAGVPAGLARRQLLLAAALVTPRPRPAEHELFKFMSQISVWIKSNSSASHLHKCYEGEEGVSQPIYLSNRG